MVDHQIESVLVVVGDFGWVPEKSPKSAKNEIFRPKIRKTVKNTDFWQNPKIFVKMKKTRFFYKNDNQL